MTKGIDAKHEQHSNREQQEPIALRLEGDCPAFFTKGGCTHRVIRRTTEPTWIKWTKALIRQLPGPRVGLEFLGNTPKAQSVFTQGQSPPTVCHSGEIIIFGNNHFRAWGFTPIRLEQIWNWVHLLNLDWDRFPANEHGENLVLTHFEHPTIPVIFNQSPFMSGFKISGTWFQFAGWFICISSIDVL